MMGLESRGAWTQPVDTVVTPTNDAYIPLPKSSLKKARKPEVATRIAREALLPARLTCPWLIPLYKEVI